MTKISDLLGKWQTIDSPEKVRANRLAREQEEDNLSDLNNLGHDEITEDFEDSPHADREPTPEELELSTVEPTPSD